MIHKFKTKRVFYYSLNIDEFSNFLFQDFSLHYINFCFEHYNAENENFTFETLLNEYKCYIKDKFPQYKDLITNSLILKENEKLVLTKFIQEYENNIIPSNTTINTLTIINNIYIANKEYYDYRNKLPNTLNKTLYSLYEKLLINKTNLDLPDIELLIEMKDNLLDFLHQTIIKTKDNENKNYLLLCFILLILTTNIRSLEKDNKMVHYICFKQREKVAINYIAIKENIKCDINCTTQELIDIINEKYGKTLLTPMAIYLLSKKEDTSEINIKEFFLHKLSNTLIDLYSTTFDNIHILENENLFVDYITLPKYILQNIDKEKYNKLLKKIIIDFQSLPKTIRISSCFYKTLKNNIDKDKKFKVLFLEEIITVDMFLNENEYMYITNTFKKGKEKEIIYNKFKNFFLNNNFNNKKELCNNAFLLLVAMKFLNKSSIEGENLKNEKIFLTRKHTLLIKQLNKVWKNSSEKIKKSNSFNKNIQDDCNFINKRLQSLQYEKILKEIYCFYSFYYHLYLQRTCCNKEYILTKNNFSCTCDNKIIIKILKEGDLILSNENRHKLMNTLIKTTEYLDIQFDIEQILICFQKKYNDININLLKRILELYEEKNYILFIPLLAIFIESIYTKDKQIPFSAKNYIKRKYNKRFIISGFPGSHEHFNNNKDKFYHYFHSILFENHNFKLRNTISHGEDLDVNLCKKGYATLLYLFFLFTCFL